MRYNEIISQRGRWYGDESLSQGDMVRQRETRSSRQVVLQPARDSLKAAGAGKTTRVSPKATSDGTTTLDSLIKTRGTTTRERLSQRDRWYGNESLSQGKSCSERLTQCGNERLSQGDTCYDNKSLSQRDSHYCTTSTARRDSPNEAG